MTGPAEISLAAGHAWADYKPREKMDEVMPYQQAARMIRHAFMSGYLAGFNDALDPEDGAALAGIETGTAETVKQGSVPKG